MTPAWSGAVAALVALLWGSPLAALGQALEIAPWYAVAHADTTLGLTTGAAYTVGVTPATLFGVGMSPLRRGRFEFAVTWGTVFLREPSAQSWGPADPKVFARLLLPAAAGVHAAIEASARLPLAEAELFPYAFGGQELEVQATFAVPAMGLHLGGGRIFTEPPSGSSLAASAVPHATHAWTQFDGRRGGFAAGIRADALIFEIEDHARALFSARLAYQRPGGLVTQLSAQAEAGPDRIFDFRLEAGFATALR